MEQHFLAGSTVHLQQLHLAAIYERLVRGAEAMPGSHLRMPAAPPTQPPSIIVPHRTRSAVLLPIVLTVYVMYWFLEFFDGFFSPLYDFLFGFHVFGLGFLTTMLFVFGVGGEPHMRTPAAVLE
jgi:hypothetical protein